MLGWLFGKGANELIETVDNAADKFVFTDQEKTELFIEYQKATLPQNLARRILAFMVVGVYLFLIISAALLYKIDLEYAKFLLKLSNDTLLAPVTVIIGFYFLKRFGTSK